MAPRRRCYDAGAALYLIIRWITISRAMISAISTIETISFLRAVAPARVGALAVLEVGRSHIAHVKHPIRRVGRDRGH